MDCAALRGALADGAAFGRFASCAGGSVAVRNICRVGFSNHARLLGVGGNEGQLADLFLNCPLIVKLSLKVHSQSGVGLKVS